MRENKESLYIRIKHGIHRSLIGEPVNPKVNALIAMGLRGELQELGGRASSADIFSDGNGCYFNVPHLEEPETDIVEMVWTENGPKFEYLFTLTDPSYYKKETRQFFSI